MKDYKLDYFKKKILEHLLCLEEDRKDLKKSLLQAESFAKGGKGLPIGTIREWKGKKYIKIAPGKWRPKYDSNSRGAKLSIAALKRKAENCMSSEELLDLILENRDRFSDKNGRPLPFVKELSDYVSRLNDKIESEKQTANGKLTPHQESLIKLVSGGHTKGEQIEIFTKMAKRGGTNGKDARVILKERYGIEQKQEFSEDAVRRREIVKKIRKEKKDNKTNKNVGGEPSGGNKEIKENFDLLNNIFKTGKSETVNNKNVGDIQIDLGSVGKKGYGLKHIVEQRYVKDHANFEEIAATLTLVLDSVKNGKIIRDVQILDKMSQDIGTLTVEKNGIIAFLGKSKNGTGNKFVITGYADKEDKKEEATDAIKAVIAQNNYAQNFVIVKDNVGAVIASLNSVSDKTRDLSRNTGISDIRKKYESSRSATGRKKTVTLPDGSKIKCHYKIVEADAPTASHDETTFTPTQGFPTTGDGKSVNDRDYQNDKDAQESVLRIAAGFNSLALDSPPIVTKDGIVISGNNRTMSSKLAAKNGTDKAYLEDLRDMIDEYGLEESDLTGFKHPRLILEVDEEHKGSYTTEEFAQFNRDTKKTMSNVEKAVKLTKTLNNQKIQSIASELSEYDTMGELYANAKSCQRFVSKLIAAEIIGENEKAQYCKSDGTLNDTGKDFVETVLVGSVLNEDNIRKLDSAGGKRIRQKIVRAILPLIENKGNGREYSFNKELNDAVEIAVTVAKDHEKYPTVETYLAQGMLFNEKKPDEVTSKLAILIHDEGEKAFSSRMKNMGAGLQNSADGEMDIFLGGVESKENLMKRFLDIKKSIQDFLTAIVQKEQTTKEVIERFLSEIA